MSNTTQIQTRLRSQAGVSIIEGLIAASISITCILGVVSSLGYYLKQKSKYDVLSEAANLEFVVINSLVNGTSYDLQARDLLVKGIVPDNVQVGLEGIPAASVSINNTPTCFTRRLQAVTCSFDTDVAAFRVTVDLQKFAVSGSSGPGQFRFAYSVETNPLVAVVPALGAIRTNDRFTPDQYGLPLPNIVYDNREAAVCPQGSAAMAGFTNEYGELRCVKMPQGSCPAGNVATGVTYNISSNSMEFVCNPIGIHIDCPEGYSILNFKPTDAVKGIKTGQCVSVLQTLATKTFSPPEAPDGQITDVIVQAACPDGYVLSDADSSCSVVPITATNGTDCTKNIWSKNGAPSSATLIGASWFHIFDYTDTGDYVVSHPPTPPTATKIVSGNTMECRLTPIAQQCGAIWVGYAQAHVGCRMLKAENADVL